MPNIAKILKEEIQRLARKEVSQAISKIRKDCVTLKKTVADQKRKLAELSRENKRLLARQAKIQKALPGDSEREAADDIRITGKQVKSLRGRLGISQADLARLVNASINIVVIWEKKSGRLNIRKPEVKKALAELKELKKAEVWERLEKTKGRKKKAEPKKAAKKTAAGKTRETNKTPGRKPLRKSAKRKKK